MNYHSVKNTLQMQAADCGAASLKMLLDDLGYEYTLGELRELACVGRDGSSLRDLMNAGEKIGFKLEPVRGKYNDPQFDNVPFLLWWNRNHFVVYEGRKGKKFFINDPASGRRELDAEEFKTGFSGICLKIISKPTDNNSYVSPNILSISTILKSSIAESKNALITAALIALLLSIPTIATAQLTSYFIDQILLRGQISTATEFLWIFASLAGITALLSYTSNTIASEATYISTLYRSFVMIKSLVKAPLNWIESRSSEEVSSRPLIASTITTSLSYNSIHLLSAISQSLIITFVILCINFWLGSICIILLATLTFISKWIDHKTDSDNRSMSIEYGKQSGLALSTLRSLRDVRSTNLENLRFSQWAGFYTNYINAQQKVSRYQIIAGIFSNGAFYIANTALIVIGPILIISKQLTLGNFVAIQYLIGIVTSGIRQVPDLLRLYQSVTSPAERLRDLFESELKEETNKIDIVIDKEKCPIISLNKIKYSYDGKNFLFEDITGDIKCTPITLIKSKPGRGKTTLMKILCGNYQLNDGEIELKWGAFTANKYKCTYIPTLPVLFDGDIADNISLTDSRVTSERIYEAAKIVGLHDSDSVGMNHKIRNSGSELSIKVRNQIAMARALASPDPIIFYDDFNPNLDKEIIINFFERLKKENRFIILTTNIDDEIFSNSSTFVLS